MKIQNMTLANAENSILEDYNSLIETLGFNISIDEYLKIRNQAILETKENVSYSNTKIEKKTITKEEPKQELKQEFETKPQIAPQIVPPTPKVVEQPRQIETPKPENKPEQKETIKPVVNNIQSHSEVDQEELDLFNRLKD